LFGGAPKMSFTVTKEYGRNTLKFEQISDEKGFP